MAGLISAGQRPTAGKLSIVRGEAFISTAPQAVTTTSTLIAGCSVTLAAQTSSAFYLAIGSFHCLHAATADGANTVSGRLRLDNVQQSFAARARLNSAVADERTMTQSWSGTLAAGSHTFTLFADASANSLWSMDSQTHIVVIVFG